MHDAPMGVVLVNYGSHRLLEANLPMLPDEYRVVVVDNWHSAGERDAVRGLGEQRAWQVEELGDNAGFGVAANHGIRAARAAGCETFVLLNPDARITEPVLRELHRHVDAHPGEMIAPVIEDSTGRKVFVGADLLLATGRMRRAGTGRPGERVQPWLTGACLAFHQSLVDAIGGFAADYFLYWEDVDLSFRAARAGFGLRVRTDLVIVHDEGGTQDRRPQDRSKSNLYYYYNARNRLVFAGRLLSRRRRLRWLVATPAASWEILMRGGRRQLLRSRAPLWSVLAGTRDGILAVLRKR